jgi:hypothetical protein
MYIYEYKTKHGIVSLVPQANGRYQVMFQEEGLGSYHTARAAASDVSGGHTFTPSSGIDLGSLNIPEDINEWHKKPFTHRRA